MTIKNLIKKAIEAKENSYSPYSKFRVGCAVLTDSGEVFTGCNVENAAFSPSLCAERNAISTAIAKGYKSFKAIAITGDSEWTYPCGVCRQFMKEFFDSTDIYIVKSETEYRKYKLEDLLPCGFGPDNLNTEEI
ncbi:MAG: cytidine deaminase [Tissierellia bacterium]|nr:cytidine deaminase [Tissierellia bacterium]